MAVSLETCLKVGGFISAVIGVGFGLYQYRSNSENEFRRQIYVARFEQYAKVADSVGVLLTAKEGKLKATDAGVTKAVISFWQLYWVKMILVESRPIEVAMFDFGQCLPLTECDFKTFKARHNRLVCELRRDLSRTWKVEFGDLQAKFNSILCGGDTPAKPKS
jgi:hypothetical protein